MKNLLLTCFSFILLIGVLMGCSNDTTAPKEEAETQAETKTDTETETKSDTETKSTGDEETDKEEQGVAEDQQDTNADVSNAVDFTKALDPKNPLSIGSYMKLGVYSTEDSKYHNVYAKINKITSESEDAEYVKKALDEHNAEGTDYQAVNKEELDLPDDIELNVVDYEVVIPKEFPSADYGMPAIHLDFRAQSVEDGGIPSNNGGAVYLALGAGEELLTKGESTKEFMPGNTYQMRGYFAMVKDYDNYVIEVAAFPDGTDDTSDMKNAYFAIK